MPRKARLGAPGALHHIMVRGINKAAIFNDDQDRIKFLWELKNGSRRHVVSIARKRIARRGVEELGLTSAEIARHLGVCTSTITRAVEKKEAGAV